MRPLRPHWAPILCLVTGLAAFGLAGYAVREDHGVAAATARRAAARDMERGEQEEAGDALTVSMRCVVWRRNGPDGFELVPLVRWEQLDYADADWPAAIAGCSGCSARCCPCWVCGS